MMFNERLILITMPAKIYFEFPLVDFIQHFSELVIYSDTATHCIALSVRKIYSKFDFIRALIWKAALYSLRTENP